MRIGNREIGPGEPCYVIAEIGSNHNCNLQTAMALIDVAGDGGADAVKFQVFKADALYSRLSAPDEWRIAKDAELPLTWLYTLAWHAHLKDLHFICSTFCQETTDAATPYCDALKVASCELVDLDLVRHIGSKGKLVILSTGMSTSGGRRRAHGALSDNADAAWLYCASTYPAEAGQLSLAHMTQLEHGPWGLSDHTPSIAVPAIAVSHGASIIEKHLTLDRKQQGSDHHYALEPAEFALMVRGIREAEAMMQGGYHDGPSMQERASTFRLRRSVHAARDIAPGAMICAEDLVVQRPSDGARPCDMERLIGVTVTKDGGYRKGEGICNGLY